MVRIMNLTTTGVRKKKKWQCKQKSCNNKKVVITKKRNIAITKILFFHITFACTTFYIQTYSTCSCKSASIVWNPIVGFKLLLFQSQIHHHVSSVLWEYLKKKKINFPWRINCLVLPHTDLTPKNMFLLESARLQFWKILIIGNLWKSLDYKFQIEKKTMSLLKSDTQKNEFKFVSLAINPMSHRT